LKFFPEIEIPYQLKVTTSLNLFCAENKYNLRTPKVLASGPDYIICKRSAGESLIDEMPKPNGFDTYINTCLRANLIWARFVEKHGNTVTGTPRIGKETVKEWIIEKLDKWSNSLLYSGKITPELLARIGEKLLNDDFLDRNMGYSHGNIIGDHLFVSANWIDLIDLEMLFGLGFLYDITRSLDWWLIVKDDYTTVTPDFIYETGAKLAQNLAKPFLRNDARIILIFRLLGILGIDCPKIEKHMDSIFDEDLHIWQNWRTKVQTIEHFLFLEIQNLLNP
jgi:hypothetical protein